MVKCESCGADLSEGAKFCSKCGAPVGVKEEFTVRSEDLVAKIKDLLHESDVSRIIVKDENGKTPLRNTSLGGHCRNYIGSLAGSFGCNSSSSNKMHNHCY